MICPVLKTSHYFRTQIHCVYAKKKAQNQSLENRDTEEPFFSHSQLLTMRNIRDKNGPKMKEPRTNAILKAIQNQLLNIVFETLQCKLFFTWY